MQFVSLATIVVVFVLAPRVSAERPPQLPPAKPQDERKTIKSDEFVFGNPAVAYRLHQFEAAARELAQEDWEHQPFHARSPRTIFWRTWWGKPAGSIDRFGYFDRQKKQQPGEERHVCRIDALRNRDQPNSVVAVCLLAAWSPRGNGWTAHVSYCFPRRHPTSGDAFDLSFKYRDENIPERNQRTIRLSDHLSNFKTRKHYDGTTYGIQVTLDAAELFTNRISSDEVRRWYASPESLRDAAPGRLDRLEKKIEADVRSGKAVRFAHGGHRSATSRTGGASGSETTRGGHAACLVRPAAAGQ